jgi:Gas vesicle synthesis protein GvpL/GvpF
VADQGRYLYAVCRGLDLDELAGLLGLGDVLVEGVESDGLVGLVSSVDLDEFGEDGLRRNLERLDWLEMAARGHDAVVQAAAAVAPTAPMRLATIFRDDDGVRRRLGEQHDRIAAVLDRVEGHEEWSVKVLTRAPEGDQVPEEPPSSGVEYLRRRREQQSAQQAGRRDADEVAEQVHQALVQLAVASRRLPPQDPRLTGHSGTMVHNAAYLVRRDLSDSFSSALGELTGEHREVLIDARGPWPPYSFAMLEEP